MNVKKFGPSPVDIQNHLYASFLEGSTADVALRVHGSWVAIYKLHRVVLIQSGFFRSLFTAGFAESTPKISSSGPDEIVIQFDDPNITRAARLYGGGPPLDIDPSLIPTLSSPLTPSFPHEPPPHDVPAGYQPATPRFLLSLLATAVYLSIPFLASQALASVLSTVGPNTAVKYLNFALGRHIGTIDHDSNDSEAAVGLESVAQIVEYEPSIYDTVSIRSSTLSDYRQVSSSSIPDLSEESEGENVTKQPLYHYGAISDKIGEACACWLARWGVDILALEERQAELVSQKGKERAHSIPGRKRSKTVPSGSTTHSPAAVTKPSVEEYCVPTIWARGGLSPEWVSAVISADTFFVRGERERYDFARRVVELRRKHGILASEEEEWVKLFDQGIYYSNMIMDDIIHISHDISLTTNQPFVPLSTVQSSHWMQSVLRHRITVRPVSSRPQTAPAPSPPPRDKELGITRITADILKTSSQPSGNNFKAYYSVPGNSSTHIGENGHDFNGTPEGGPLSMDQLFSPSSSLSPPPSSPTLKASTPTDNVPLTTEAQFFGLHPSIFTPSSAIASDPVGKSQWSPYPPYRFAVEFWDLELLKEKSRLYSRTIWYAGSLFNTYIQVVRKKGQVQLGIYLHRQSSIEPIPAASAPAPPPAAPTSSTPSQNLALIPHARPSLPHLFPPLTHSITNYPSSRSMTPSSGGSSASTSGSPSTSLPSSLSASSSTSPSPALPATSSPVTPPQPYRDPRPSISAYFMISCASATGSSQTRFTSAPDVFSVGQSWGWKSSSLSTEEYMDTRAEGEAPSQTSIFRFATMETKRKQAPRLARPAARYWKGKAPKGAAEIDSESEEEDVHVMEEEGDVAVGGEQDFGEEEEEETLPMRTDIKAAPKSMNVALKDVNISRDGKVIVAGREESGRTALEEEESEEESEEEDEKPSGGAVKAESDESSEYETDSEEEEKPQLKFRPVFVPKRARATIAEKEALLDLEETEKKRQQEAEERKKQSHDLVAESIKRELAEKDKEEDVNDVDDTDGVDPAAEFEAWRLRELGRIKQEKEEEIRREEEREEVERRRAMPEEQRMKEDVERANKLREEKPKGQQKFLQKYWHKGAFHQDEEILKKHDFTAPTESAVDVSMLPQVMQVKNFGKRSRTKYTHLVDQDTTLPSGGFGGTGSIKAGGKSTDGGGCFTCGGPHLKKDLDAFRSDCPQNTGPLTERGPSGANSAPTGPRRWGNPPDTDSWRDRRDDGGRESGWKVNRDEQDSRKDDRHRNGVPGLEMTMISVVLAEDPVRDLPLDRVIQRRAVGVTMADEKGDRHQNGQMMTINDDVLIELSGMLGAGH
ncbi:hypothetical protein H0H92_007430 [Tricholoma furcatifolium]|nr:hypothetical protein H0H92_007430 [Tricholoma furcatifolium]